MSKYAPLVTDGRKRTGAQTKAEAQRVALSLFISQGYEATSLRQIADELGIRKASLYYHFANKEEIVTAGMASRAAEAEDLLRWARAQPPAPDLLDRTVLRWVDSMSVEKLRGIRFVNANPVLMRTIATNSGLGIRDNLSAVVDLLVGDTGDPVRTLLIRMALLSINAAVGAAAGTSLTDNEIVATARRASLAILSTLSIDDQTVARPQDGESR